MLARRTVTLACMLLATGVTAAAEPLSPDRVPGLAAWYDLEPVHRRAHDGMALVRWADRSENGRDLLSVREQAPAVFRTKVLNEKPAVSIHRATRLDVSEPFELYDHTIFLVYSAEYSKRALLSSDEDDRSGIVIEDESKFHYLQHGGAAYRYNRFGSPSPDFKIAMLGRELGSLRADADGLDVSSGREIATPLRVGRLFEIRHTRFVTSDGEGLLVAEMIFFDRYLKRAEREGVMQYLADKYALPLYESPTAEPEETAKEIDEAAVRVDASNRGDLSVNDGLVALPWDFIARSDEPFRFGSGEESSRIYSMVDGARIRVTVRLRLRSKVEGAELRLLFQINRETWVEPDAFNDPFEGAGADKSADLQLQAEMTLDDGDFFEVITTREGAEGPVRVQAREALLIVERIE
jgi:hypothetical protein